MLRQFSDRGFCLSELCAEVVARGGDGGKRGGGGVADGGLGLLRGVAGGLGEGSLGVGVGGWFRWCSAVARDGVFGFGGAVGLRGGAVGWRAVG